MNSRKASSRSRATTWRWIVAREQRRRSRRGGKSRAWSSGPFQRLAVSPFQPDQETVTEPDQHGIAVKAGPHAAVVLLPAQETLGFCVKLLDPIAPMRILEHPGQRRIQREVAPEVFPVARAPGRTLPDQPADMRRSLTVHPPTAEGDELGAQPTLTACAPAHGLPRPTRLRQQDRIGTLNGGRSTARQRHTEIGPHGHDLPFAPGFQTIENMRVISLVGIRDDTRMAHATGVRFIQQGQSHLGLARKGDRLGNLRLLPTLRVIHPVVRQVQPRGDRPGQAALGRVAVHADLTVGDLAQRARLLSGHPHRVAALFGEPRIIKDQNAIAFRWQSPHHRDTLAIQRRFIPDPAGQQALQLLRTDARHNLGQRLAVLVGMFGQQTGHIPLDGHPAFPSPKLHVKKAEKLGQFWNRFAGGLQNTFMFRHASKSTISN